MKLKIILILLLTQLLLQAQSDFDIYLQSIERNNKSLKAARQLSNAEQLGAKTGIYLANPELSYDLLSGNGENYSEMIISQSFDFPTTYSNRNKIAEISSEQSVEQYKTVRLNTLNNAAHSYANQVITSRKLKIISELDSMLIRLKGNAERKLELGDANILETNRIRTESVKNKVEVNLLLTRLEALNQEITALNGGIAYEIDYPQSLSIPLPVFSDSLIQHIVEKHPNYMYWMGEITKSAYDIKLKKSNSLPKFELGYRQDKSVGGSFNGIAAGISVPLFENKNSVKLAKAKQTYAREELGAEQLNIESDLLRLIEEYKIVSGALQEIEQMIALQNTPELLLKAYESGQIDYTEFFSEYSSYKTTQIYIEDIRLKSYIIEMQLYLLSSI